MRAKNISNRKKGFELLIELRLRKMLPLGFSVLKSNLLNERKIGYMERIRHKNALKSAFKG